MVFDRNPMGELACNGTGVSKIKDLGLMYLHTEDTTPAHRMDEYWAVKTKDIYPFFLSTFLSHGQSLSHEIFFDLSFFKS